MSEAASNAQPSASAKITNFKGSENIMGEIITIPKEVRILATAKSMAIKGR
jgi:hypothetical protein